jgi:pimeloyl-ACP methyl ester carboxylesterase
MPSETNGAQPPVLLVHGWGGSFESTWKSNGWCEALKVAGRRVIAVDLPGHGRGYASHDPADYSDLASSVEAKLGAEPVVDAIGFSLGGKVVLELAARNPARFRRLVIAGLGQNIFAPERMGELLAGVLERGVNEGDPEAVRNLISYIQPAKNDPKALAACLRRPANPVLTPERLSIVTAPLMLISGDHDTVAQPIEPLKRALPQAKVETLPDMDHFGLPSSLVFRITSMAFLANVNL